MAEIFSVLIIVMTCCFQLTVQISDPPKKMFGVTADDLFESAIGDVNEVHKQLLDRLHKDPSKRGYIENARTEPPTATQKPISTALPPVDLKPINMEQLKLKMKKAEINSMLRNKGSPIPNFKAGEDDPLLLAQRYKSIAKKKKRTSKHPVFRRELYFDYPEHENRTLIRMSKVRIIEIMQQIIYMTRYKMSIMTDLRKKYMKHIKYKIGYLFALLRLVRYQQKVVYNTIKQYYMYMTDANIPMTFYFKILKLDVDLRDIIRYILRLNYDYKLEKDPDYYKDSLEFNPLDMLEAQMDGKAGMGDMGGMGGMEDMGGMAGMGAMGGMGGKDGMKGMDMAGMGG